MIQDLQPLPPIPVTPIADRASIEAEVTARFEQWFHTHHLDLPAETRAEFIDMGVDAVEQNPQRPQGEVLDELIAELDDRLGSIVDEAADAHTTARANHPRGSWLRRALGRGR